MRAAFDRLRHDEGGLSVLEWIGLISVVVTFLVFIPPVRGVIGDAYDAVFKQIDPDTGRVTSFSVAARGILITVTSVAVFLGTGWLILSTNVGQRLAFLITGAATFGWLTIGGMLFVVYAPRGLRPSSVEGLNSFQIRIPAIGMTLGSFVLFLIFVVALDRFEREAQD